MELVPEEMLWEFTLGTLPADVHARLAAQVESSPVLRQRLAEVQSLLAGMATMAGPPVAPSPALKKRLLDSVSGQERFAPLLDRLAAFIDLSVERTRDILRMLDSPADWKPSVLPGLMQYDFPPGPRRAGAEVGLVKLPVGLHFPRHSHTGEEHVMVLAGSFLEVGSSTVMRPGDVGIMMPGSVHAFDVVGDETCILMAVLTGPLDFH